MNQFRKEAIWHNKQTFSWTAVGVHTGPDIGEQVGNIIKCFNVCSARLSKSIPTNLSHWEKCARYKYKWCSQQYIASKKADDKQYKCLEIMVYWINYFISSHIGILCCYWKR